MAYQSQTYGNNNSGYYIQGSETIIPSSVSALMSPVEFLLNSTIQGPYFGALSQELSTFTISENETVGLSTINALIMNPASKVTQMFVRDKTDVADQPIIQQWTPASTIVNGVFKAGNQNLNDEANAYYIQNTTQVTTQGQGDLRQRTNLPTNSTRFDNEGNDPFSYVEINQSLQIPSLVVRNFGAFSQMNVSSFMLSTGTPPIGNPRVELGYSDLPPFQAFVAGQSDLDIVTNNGNTVPAKFKADGTVSFLSTITAPTVSTTTLNSVLTVAKVGQISSLQLVNNISNNPLNVNITLNQNGSTDMSGLLTVPSISTLSLASNFASIPDLSGVSTINAVPVIDYLIGNPVGTVINWASRDLNLIPPGYLLCDGSYVLQATYPKLWIIISNTWDPFPPAGLFRLPDCRGKVLAGSMTINSPEAGINNGSPYTVRCTLNKIDNVTIPAFLGGGSRACMRVSNLSNQLYVGMKVSTTGGGYDNFAQIVRFIDSDGLYGNETPQGVQPARSVLVMFNISQATTLTLPQTIEFTNESTDTRLYPFVGKMWETNLAIRSGIGSHFIVNQPYETSNHTHVWGQGGASGQSGLGPRCGDPNNPLDTSGTNTLFTYPTNSLAGGTTNGPSATDILPYNIAMWQLIKY